MAKLLGEKRHPNPSIGRTALSAMLVVFWATTAAAQTEEIPAEAEASEESEDTAEEAAAEATEASEPIAQAPENVEKITVTGSRIARSNLSSPVPVTVIDAEFIQNSGTLFLGDLLSLLPQLQPTRTSANSQRFIGTTGGAFQDLRALGIDRTLTLVNGRRHVGGGSLSTAVDMNTIPVDLIERIEILTGGASAVYGSDAITGVVNIVMKDGFEGVTTRAQYNISARGDAESYFVSVTAGSDFADGRGNAAFNVEYAQRDALPAEARDFASTDYRTLPNPDDNDAPGFDDGIPDEINTPNAGLNFITRNGVVYPTFGPSTLQGTFSADGSLRPFDFGNPAPNGFEQEGGEFLRLAIDPLLPRQERILATSLMTYQLHPKVEMYAETKFMLTQQRGSGSGQPSFDNGADLFIQRDNAFLPGQLGALMDSRGDSEVLMRRFNIDLGQRDDTIDRILLRTSLGFRGDINDNISYDVGFNWGRSTQTSVTGNNRVNERFFASTDAVVDVNGEVNGNPGEIVCRVNLQAARGEDLTLPDGSPAPSYVLADANGNCVPTSVFGDGAVGDEAADFANSSTALRDSIEQVQVMGFVTATSDGYFELPGGPLQLVIGAEYRRDIATQGADLGDALGLTFFNAFSPTSGTIDVGEIFGEIAVPVLGGLPGVEELTLTAGGRLSNYNLEQVGTVLSGSINGVYRPVDDLTIRGSFSRAVRSPNVGDAFQGLSQNFFAVQDPCDEDSIADGGATREANCAAIAEQIGFVGFEAGVTDPEDEVTRSGFSGGNVNLEEEVSDSWTVGGVITPRWIPRLVVTVDYYNFRIDNAIATPGAQRIIDNCVDLPSIDNQFCDLVTRDPTTFEISNILNTNVNLAAFETEGVDWEVRYNFEIEEAAELLGAGAIGDVGTLSFQLFGNHLIRRTDFPDQENEDEEQNLDGFLGFPKNQFTLQSVYALENFSFSWQTFWQEGFIRDDIEEDFDANPDQTQPLTVSQRGYHNIQARYRMLDSITVYGGINNLFDNEPPLAFNGTTFGGGFYDNIGRNFYFGAQLDL